MFFPPEVMIRSFFLPVIRRNPSASDLTEVAGAEPAAGGDRLGGLGRHLVVSLHDVPAPDEEFPVIGDGLLDTGAGRAHPPEPEIVDAVDMGIGHVLRHADPLQDKYAGGMEEPRYRWLERGCTADAEPDPAAQRFFQLAEHEPVGYGIS